jgi:pyruvate formate lyase activating enzyme
MNNTQGLVFHIIHGSFVDGYGIRTTVFLKGCPLRCLWCCNPEGQQSSLELKVTQSQCDGCGKCVHICPDNAIQIIRDADNGPVKIDRALCSLCGKCIGVCYKGALDYFGRYYTVDKLFDIVRKDVQYYSASGGGVTIGGGEPTFQPLFTLAFMRKCQENYINVALDTCGYTLNNEGLKILEEADLILFDIKGIEPIIHLRNTGVTNEIILSNLKHLDAMQKSIIIRLPIIPGYNDKTNDIICTAEFLSNLKAVERVDLLTYHEYGRIKYSQLDRKYKLQVQSPTEEHMDEIKATFERYGLKVQIGG